LPAEGALVLDLVLLSSWSVVSVSSSTTSSRRDLGDLPVEEGALMLDLLLVLSSRMLSAGASMEAAPIVLLEQEALAKNRTVSKLNFIVVVLCNKKFGSEGAFAVGTYRSETIPWSVSWVLLR
jgi:hypothetical protein